MGHEQRENDFTEKTIMNIRDLQFSPALNVVIAPYDAVDAVMDEIWDLASEMYRSVRVRHPFHGDLSTDQSCIVWDIPDAYCGEGGNRHSRGLGRRFRDHRPVHRGRDWRCMERCGSSF